MTAEALHTVEPSLAKDAWTRRTAETARAAPRAVWTARAPRGLAAGGRLATGWPVNRPDAVASLSPQQRAERAAAAMWAADRASKWLGMTLDAVGPGRAEMSMTVAAHHTNGHGICHGGYIFTLADSAFAFACNAYNEVTVASGFDVNLTAAARGGDVLTATARELSKSGRTGVYDIEVVNERGERVAAFRGRSYTMKGKPLVEGLPMGRDAAPNPR